MFKIKGFLIFLFLFPITMSKKWSEAEVASKCFSPPQYNSCVKLDSNYYLISNKQKLNWFEAERFCRRIDGFLMTVDSKHELAILRSYLKFVKLGGVFWTGGNNLRTDGTFYSISTGEPLPYYEWTPGQPDNAGKWEHCVTLWQGPNYGMNDDKCIERYQFICELNSTNPQDLSLFREGLEDEIVLAPEPSV